ncbi:MAG: ABC transporter permease [Pseudomonadota bacterium]
MRQLPKPESKSGATKYKGRIFNQILPDTGLSGRALTASMSIMCYLACLALGTLIIVSKSVNLWSSNIASEVTVQVRPADGIDIQTAIDAAVSLLKETPGVTATTVLDQSDAAELLEPWLGSGKVLEELPIPRLISVIIDPESPPDYEALAKNVTDSVPGGTLDTHRQWQAQITQTAGTFKMSSYGVLFLVCIAAIALVIFATRAAMEANRDTIQVLHLAGAEDNFVAYQVQRHFLKMGARAGIIGMTGGLASFAALAFATKADQTAGFAQASRQLLYGPLAFTAENYAVLVLVPLMATLICVVTARLAVVTMLRRVV